MMFDKINKAQIIIDGMCYGFIEMGGGRTLEINLSDKIFDEICDLPERSILEIKNYYGCFKGKISK